MDRRWSDLPRRVRDAIRRYVDAAIAESWKGGGDPADWPHVDAELKAAKERLTQVLCEAVNRHSAGSA